MKILIFLATIMVLVGCASSPNRSNAFNVSNEKVTKFCSVMHFYSYHYYDEKFVNNSGDNAHKIAVNKTIQQFGISPNSNFNLQTMGMAILANQLKDHKYRPGTVASYITAQCLTTRGLKKDLPNGTDEGLKSIHQILALCESKHQDDDSTGACVLDSLRPLAG